MTILCVHADWAGIGRCLDQNAKRHTDSGPEYPHEEWEENQEYEVLRFPQADRPSPPCFLEVHTLGTHSIATVGW